MSEKPKKSKAPKPRCPKGHQKGLTLRIMVDAPFHLEGKPGDWYTMPDEDKTTWDWGDEGPGKMIGSTGGVWCPTCEEWYSEPECAPEDKS